MASLNDFKSYIHTDKFNDWSWSGPGQGHDYVGMFYDQICLEIEPRATAILEIGVNAGHSQLLWSAYFKEARIYGCDVAPAPFPNHNRIVILSGLDAYQDHTIKLFQSLEPQGYDLVIDDGPHTFESQLYTVQNYWSLVKPDRYMVIEDIIGNGSYHTLQGQLTKFTVDVRGYRSPASSPGNEIFALVAKKV